MGRLRWRTPGPVKTCRPCHNWAPRRAAGRGTQRGGVGPDCGPRMHEKHNGALHDLEIDFVLGHRRCDDHGRRHDRRCATCESLLAFTLANTTITSAQVTARRVRSRSRRGPPVNVPNPASLSQPPGVLPRDGDAHADQRLGHQDRGVAAGRRGLERQAAVGRQRRVGRRRFRYPALGDGRRGRLRDGGDRHRPRRQHGELRAGTSREDDRLRLPRRARDDRGRQGDHRRVLRQRAGAVLLERLLDRRAAGADGSAGAIPPTTTASSPARRSTIARVSSPRSCGWRTPSTATEASYIPPAKYPAIHGPRVDACDAHDGLKDGLIDDPRAVPVRSEGARSARAPTRRRA